MAMAALEIVLSLVILLSTLNWHLTFVESAFGVPREGACVEHASGIQVRITKHHSDIRNEAVLEM